MNSQQADGNLLNLFYLIKLYDNEHYDKDLN